MGMKQHSSSCSAVVFLLVVCVLCQKIDSSNGDLSFLLLNGSIVDRKEGDAARPYVLIVSMPLESHYLPILALADSISESMNVVVAYFHSKPSWFEDKPDGLLKFVDFGRFPIDMGEMQKVMSTSYHAAEIGDAMSIIYNGIQFPSFDYLYKKTNDIFQIYDVAAVVVDYELAGVQYASLMADKKLVITSADSLHYLLPAEFDGLKNWIRGLHRHSSATDAWDKYRYKVSVYQYSMRHKPNRMLSHHTQFSILELLKFYFFFGSKSKKPDSWVHEIDSDSDSEVIASKKMNQQLKTVNSHFHFCSCVFSHPVLVWTHALFYNKVPLDASYPMDWHFIPVQPLSKHTESAAILNGISDWLSSKKVSSRVILYVGSIPSFEIWEVKRILEGITEPSAQIICIAPPSLLPAGFESRTLVVNPNLVSLSSILSLSKFSVMFSHCDETIVTLAILHEVPSICLDSARQRVFIDRLVALGVAIRMSHSNLVETAIREALQEAKSLRINNSIRNSLRNSTKVGIQNVNLLLSNEVLRSEYTQVLDTNDLLAFWTIILSLLYYCIRGLLAIRKMAVHGVSIVPNLPVGEDHSQVICDSLNNPIGTSQSSSKESWSPQGMPCIEDSVSQCNVNSSSNSSVRSVSKLSSSGICGMKVREREGEFVGVPKNRSKGKSSIRSNLSN